VKFYKCGSNHYANHCPSSHDKDNELQKPPPVQKQPDAKQADANKLTPPQEKPDKDETTGVGLVTNVEDAEQWGRDVDYSRLMFFQHCDCGDIPTGTPDLEDLKTSNSHIRSSEHVMKLSQGCFNKLLTLLESQSTVDLFCNSKMLKDIHKINTYLKVFSAGGVTGTNKIGYLPGYGWVWYHPEGIANILLLA